MPNISTVLSNKTVPNAADVSTLLRDEIVYARNSSPNRKGKTTLPKYPIIVAAKSG